MKVLFITERHPLQRGGVAVSAQRHLVGLGRRVERFDALHLTADLPPGQVAPREFEAGTIYSVGRAPREDESLQLLETVAGSLHAHVGYDLMHGFYAVPSGAVAVLAARTAGLPSVVSVRGNDVDRSIYQGTRASLLLWTLAHADAVLTVSSDLARRVTVLTGRGQNVHFIPNGVDTSVFHPEAPQAPQATPLIAFSGEMRLKKGLHPLLTAMASLPDVRLLLMGGVRREERDAYAAWRAQSPAASQVSESRYERDEARLRAQYAAADLMVFPSLWEGMPNSVLEAMACARPVLASAVGGIRDVIVHGVTGFLVPLHELGGLAQAIASVLARPAEERAAVGLRARAHVLEHHDPRQEAERILEVYRAVRDRSDCAGGRTP